MTGRDATSGCLHCGSPIPESLAADARFCCSGCAAVHALLVDGQLTRYYDLARGSVLPVSALPRTRSEAWLDVALAEAESGREPFCTLTLDVQGIQCAACVWLIGELFHRREGGVAFTLNPALGKARLSWRRGELDVRAFVREVEQFGYLCGPNRKHAIAASGELLLRLGICTAATMNVMLFSFSFYFGLSARDGSTFQLFQQLSLALASAVVLVGGWPFFKSALLGLRRGVAHLDLPIALGILLVYGASVAQTLQGRGAHAYLDTLCTFVTLMLVGRWLQRRVLDRNRQFLLQDAGADGLLVRRREEGGAISIIAAPRVRAEDALLVAPGDLVPVDCTLTSARGSFSLDWITGEAHARELAQGQPVPAGAFNAGPGAAELRAAQPFSDSSLPALLTAGARKEGGDPHTRFFEKLARYYVGAVLTLAAAGFLFWLHAGAARALDIAAAVLVVTCPCAIGLAIPLADELTLASLRRRGVLVRSADLFDRLARVRAVIFDKTGTLTLGKLELLDRAPLIALTPEQRDAAYEMAIRSNHPVSRCLAPVLAGLGARSQEGAAVHELAGAGLALARGDSTWRLGSASWAAPGAAGSLVDRSSGETVLAQDGVVLARLRTREGARTGTARALADLEKLGLPVWLVSGDAKPRVEAFAAQLGLAPARVRGEATPQDKARFVSEISDGGALFVGDGVNDSLAFDAALCAGTPALDRPVMPGKADFLLLGDDLSALLELFASARTARRVSQRILALAFTYNALAIAVSLAGLMTPLGAAIAMPASSISILLYAANAVASARPDAPVRRAVRAPALQEARG